MDLKTNKQARNKHVLLVVLHFVDARAHTDPRHAHLTHVAALLDDINRLEFPIEGVAREAMRLAAHKLPVKTKFIVKENA